MTLEEYKAFLSEGNRFVKYEVWFDNGRRVISYVIYAKKFSEAREFGVLDYEVELVPCCYLHTDYRGHKSFTLCDTNRYSFLITNLSKASEDEIRELYKHLKHYGYQRN